MNTIHSCTQRNVFSEYYAVEIVVGAEKATINKI